MAVPPSRELTNKKILEELELNKKLLKQGCVAPLNTANTLPGASIPNIIGSGGVGITDNVQSLSSTQRNALNLAHAQSYGFYIAQDSSFGNLILPVLPRFDKK